MTKALEALRDLIKSSTGGKFKKIYIGDPLSIATSEMPALIINPVITEIDAADNQNDDIIYNIDINVVLNLKEFLNRTQEQQSGFVELVNYFEEEDSNGNFTSDSLIKIIRNNLVLGTNMIVENVGSIEYGIRERNPGEDVVMEGSMHITISTVKNYG